MKLLSACVFMCEFIQRAKMIINNNNWVDLCMI